MDLLSFILGIAALWLVVGGFMARIAWLDPYLPDENRVIAAVHLLLVWPFIMVRGCADAAREEGEQ